MQQFKSSGLFIVSSLPFTLVVYCAFKHTSLKNLQNTLHLLEQHKSINNFVSTLYKHGVNAYDIVLQ